MSPDTTQADQQRKSFLLAGLVLLLVILVGVVAVTLVSEDNGAASDDQSEKIRDGETRPGIVPRPGEGTAPEEPGDRGGWAQLALFALMLGAMVAIAVVVVRGTKRTRAGRQAWVDAAQDPSD